MVACTRVDTYCAGGRPSRDGTVRPTYQKSMHGAVHARIRVRAHVPTYLHMHGILVCLLSFIKGTDIPPALRRQHSAHCACIHMHEMKACACVRVGMAG